MMMQFKKANLATVREAFEAIHGKLKPAESIYDVVTSKLADVRIAMAGGPQAIRHLQHRQGESAQARRNRAAVFENPNILRLIVDTRADMAYGNPPTRAVSFAADPKGQASMDLSKAFTKAYEGERVATAFRTRMAPWSIRDNSSVVKVWFDPNDGDGRGAIRMSTLKKEFVVFVHDPRDVDRFLGAVELVRLAKGRWARFLWTTDEIGWIDDKWDWVSGPAGEVSPQPNPTPGITQYIQFGFDHPSEDCESDVFDILLNQVSQMQTRANTATGHRTQMLAIPYIVGETRMQKQRDAVSGQEFVYLGHDKPLLLKDGGTAGFIQPGFKLAEASDYEMARFKHYLEVYGVTAVAADSSAAPEQPMALAIKMYRALRERTKHITAFKDAEEALANSVVALAAYHDLWDGLTLENVDDVVVDVKFPDNVLPTDLMVERQQAMAEVNDGLRTRRRYLREFVMPGASDEEIQVEEEELDAEAQDRQQMVTSSLQDTLGVRRPPGGGATGPVTGGNGKSAADALIAGLEQGRKSMAGAAT